MTRIFHPTRTFRPLLLALAASALATPAGAAFAAVPDAVSSAAVGAVKEELAHRVTGELKPFYAARGWQPLWVTPSGAIRPAAMTLLRQLRDVDVDGLSTDRLRLGDLDKAIDRATDGDPANLARLELAASRALIAYVGALREAPRAEMIYESNALRPALPTAEATLQAAAAAGSLDDYVARMGWMNPLYAPLRTALLSHDYGNEQRRQLQLNLERVRAIPAYPADRYVLVDTAAARLWMYEKGKPVDSMKVVVGKPDNQTPMMAGFLSYAILNPYWNVPDDLVQKRIATNVLDRGLTYLKGGGYEVLSGWDDAATPIDPSLVDWRAVADGSEQVRVRQQPGGANFMGKVKFMFPNELGIYLHDTPEKNLMLKDQRNYSSGCVRLEDAPRLGRWLMGKPLPRKTADPELKVPLPEPVPVYITYLTAFPEQSGTIAFRSDTYGRDTGDGTRLTGEGSAVALAR